MSEPGRASSVRAGPAGVPEKLLRAVQAFYTVRSKALAMEPLLSTVSRD